MIQVDSWTGCYDLGWQNILCPAAFSHPAKFSRGLIFRIIEHALASGMIQPGQTVLDPFGGICAGALPCLQYGLHWVGVELEPKFVELGRENIALWNDRYAAHFPNWGTAQVLQGDSRRLAEVVSAAGLVVSSPPYADNLASDTRKTLNDAWQGLDANGNKRGGAILNADYGSTPGQLATLPPGTPPTPDPQPPTPCLISSPPFAGNTGGRGEASRNGINPALFDRHSGGMKKGTGDDPANLDHLPQGTPPMAIVSSPPYVDSMEKSGGIDPAKSNHIGGPHSQMNRSDTRYGEANGQLGAMKAGAVIGSPPFEDMRMLKGGENILAAAAKTRGNNKARLSKPKQEDLGQTPNQLGNESGQTFWEAARLIVEQCALLLPVGGAAIWVVKGYIKNGKYVDFPGQWQALCEACGFETVHIHRAMLVKRNGSQAGFDGEMVSKDVARKSFFRRLHERRRPDLAIDWETVLCMRKAA